MHGQVTTMMSCRNMPSACMKDNNFSLAIPLPTTCVCRHTDEPIYLTHILIQCIHTCMHPHKCVHILLHICEHIHLCLHTFMHILLCITHSCAHTYLYTIFVHTPVYTCVHENTYAHYLHTCTMFTHLYTHLHYSQCTHLQIYLYT